jgi:hypothetical protein
VSWDTKGGKQVRIQNHPRVFFVAPVIDEKWQFEDHPQETSRIFPAISPPSAGDFPATSILI